MANESFTGHDSAMSGAHAELSVIQDWLESVLQSGRAIGGQAAVSVDGGSTEVVVAGDQIPGSGMSPALLFNVWCASKPVTAIHLLALLENRGLSLDVKVSDICEDLSPGATAGEVLCHTGGLRGPNGAAARFVGLEESASAVRRSSPSAGSAFYTDFAMNVVVADMIGALSGLTPEQSVARFLAQIGLTGQVTFEPGVDQLARPLDHFGFYIHGLPERRVPLLHDAAPQIASRSPLLRGAYASAGGLCNFYRLVGEVFGGGTVEGFPSRGFLTEALATSRRPRVWDEGLDKTCAFSCGFMVDLEDHGYGEHLSESAIGHTGLMGSPTAFYDPQRKVAAAFIINGLDQGPGHGAGWRSSGVQAVLDAII